MEATRAAMGGGLGELTLQLSCLDTTPAQTERDEIFKKINENQIQTLLQPTTAVKGLRQSLTC